jgi:hypothetical protein
VGPIILGLLFFAVLVVLLARFAPSAAARRLSQAERRAGHPLRSPIAPREFRRLIGDLLVRGMGLEVVSEEVNRDASRLVLRRRGNGVADALYVALVVPSPPGHIVDQTRVVELEQTVTALGAAGGMLFTPYAIDMTGLVAVRGELEMVDGVRLRELLARHLPERVVELEPLPV